MIADAACVGEYLAGFLTADGLIDPEEGQVCPHSYATEFFAWLCAKLYLQTRNKKWLSLAVTATRAALEVFRQGRRCDWKERKYHWEFKNLALIHVEQLIGSTLPSSLRPRLRAALRVWVDWNIESANWTAMRMLNYEMRYRRFGAFADRIRSCAERELLLGRQTGDGFFPDRPDSYSLQYHAYTLAILALYFEQNGSERVWESLNRGAELLRHFVTPAGEFNYYGRGQRQLFGYASLILAFSILSHHRQKRRLADPYAELAMRVYEHVRPYQNADGAYPLVLSEAGRPFGWYKYNLASDYLAFYALFILLANPVPPARPATIPQKERGIFLFASAGLVVVKEQHFQATLSYKGRNLSEPLGLVHLWPGTNAVFGGPEAESALGTLQYDLNYIGPLVEGRPMLQRCSGKLTPSGEDLRVTYTFSDFEVEQSFSFSPELTLQLTLRAKGEPRIIQPLSIAGARHADVNIALFCRDAIPSPVGLKCRMTSCEQRVEESLSYVIQWPNANPVTDNRSLELTSVVFEERGTLSRRFRILRHTLLKLIWIIYFHWLKG